MIGHDLTACPVCCGQTLTRIRYVPWGGLLAPRLYHLLHCGTCGTRFSGQDGRSEQELIRGYVARVLIGLLILGALGVVGLFLLMSS